MSQVVRSQRIYSVSLVGGTRPSVKDPDGIKENIIFKLCSDISDDPHWKNILLDGYRGVFPKGISFKGGLLIYKHKEVKVPSHVNDAYAEIVRFYKQICGIRSPMDKERERYQQREQQTKQQEVKGWSDFRSKNVRKLIISEYVCRIGSKYQLTAPQVKDLITLININVTAGNIEDRDVEMVDGQIANISKLTYNPDTKKFNVTSIKRAKKVVKSKAKIAGIDDDDVPKDDALKEKGPIKQWNKYLLNLAKSSKCAGGAKPAETSLSSPSVTLETSTYPSISVVPSVETKKRKDVLSEPESTITSSYDITSE